MRDIEPQSRFSEFDAVVTRSPAYKPSQVVVSEVSETWAVVYYHCEDCEVKEIPTGAIFGPWRLSAIFLLFQLSLSSI